MKCPLCHTIEYYDGIFGGNCINSNCSLFKNGKTKNLNILEENVEVVAQECVIDFDTQITFRYNHVAWKISSAAVFIIWIYKENTEKEISMCFKFIDKYNATWIQDFSKNEKYGIKNNHYTRADAAPLINTVFNTYKINPKDYIDLTRA